ncbi:MAG: cytochrome b/b6 domain-containing protein [Pseudomonadales bacterium]
MDKYPIWDFPTRLFHWALLISLSGSWITAEAGFDWTQVHIYFGYTALGLILFRIIWGICGTPYARFTTFIKSPLKALKELGQLASAKPTLSPGHSATGGWATVVLLLLIAIQATTGLFVSDDIFYAGPYNPVVSSDLAGRLAYIHHLNFSVLQGFVALHIFIIAWYQLRKGENLTAAMLTGNKRVDGPVPQPVITPWLRFVLVAAFAALSITLLVWFAPEPVYLY